ncbi:MAG TPA: hypothetical protein PK983_05025 [Syntrophales bacterium]|nr:hypothetical protein [Syntrophales bacterium]
MLRPIYENIPDDLKAIPRHVNWRSVRRGDGGKPTKPPYQPDGNLAKINDPQTWSTFDAVKAAADRFDGIGFVLSNDDDIVGLDFDKCRCPAFDGVTDWANSLAVVSAEVANHLQKLNTYTEVSPTGRGIHVFVKGHLPVDGKKKEDYEAYQSGRYLTLTGHVLEGFPRNVEARQAELSDFFQLVFCALENPPEPEKKPRYDAPTGDYEVILEKAFNSTSGDKINRLFHGDISDYPSQSEADLALCNHLAFWLGGNASSIDAAFRKSGLFREKWDEKHFSDKRTYGEATIKIALDGCRSFYGDRFHEGHGGGMDQASPRSVVWPDPLDEAAYYGVIGEWVKLVLPHTEADPAALLFQALLIFGNIVGRNPYFKVEATEHHCNEFLLLVGNTSKGRKGTSWDHARSIARTIDPPWELECIKSGLTSGEGLIFHVRDPQERRGKCAADEGVADKRLVVFESEFASVLKIIERKDNTLSATMRDAWDRGHLRTLAKNSPVKATGAHISIVSHVTKEELITRLSNNESFNGFANRFLFVCVKRSKLLPEGGGIVDLSGVLPRFHEASIFAKKIHEIRRDEEARAIWLRVYEHLTRDQPGILGSVLARDAAHVVRLSMIYALLDRSTTIRREHLMAALACWEYVEASARFIFGSMTGDPMADKIYDAACSAGENGITRTFINNNLFQRNVASDRIDQAIRSLHKMGRIQVESIGTGGRKEQRIYVKH